MGNFGIQIRPLAGMVQAINQLGQTLFKPPSDSIRGIDSDSWFSPLQPVAPFAPAGTEPKQFQFWWGQNLTWTPRFDAAYSASQLRYLATYPLARICIENVKDGISKASWEIQPKPEPGEPRKAAARRGIGDENLLKLNRFFEMPDREHVWPDWLSPFLDDMLVIDAGAILIRKTYNGTVVELPTIRGDMINRYIDENGMTPMPPQPAYAQIWWGLPTVNLTTDQLIYRPRKICPGNTVSSNLYGRSPTECAASWIETGMERLSFKLAYYKAGSIPDMLQVVPRDVSPEKIAEAMRWQNSELAGNLAARRGMRMIQGFNEPGKPDQVLFPKEPLLADPYDDLETRYMAFNYGISPQRLSKMVNRAAAQQQDESSDVEGMLPYFAWLKNSVIDHIIQRVMGYTDYEMVFDPVAEPNPEKQSVIVSTYVKTGVLTPNEGRARIGEEPNSTPEADQLGIVTGNGFVPFGSMAAGLQPGELPPAAPTNEGKQSAKPTQSDEEDETPPSKPAKPNKANGHKLAVQANAHAEVHVSGFAAGSASSAMMLTRGVASSTASLPLSKKAIAAREKPSINPGKLLPPSILAKHSMEQTLSKKFKTMKRRSLKLIGSGMGLPHGHFAKADESQDEILNQILAAIADDWQEIADSAEDWLKDSALAGASNGGIQLDITDEDMLGGINETAIAWAQNRAAELVGMKKNAFGDWVTNPNAKWAISDTTRDKLRDIIADVFKMPDEIAPGEHVTLRDVENRIDASGIFSDTRASLIARTEISRAQSLGNLFSWQESGLVKSVNIQLSADHDTVDSCDDAEADNPYPIDDVPDVPLHPSCLCSLVLNEFTEDVE